jgi:hypothetical protein
LVEADGQGELADASAEATDQAEPAGEQVEAVEATEDK